MQSDDVLDYGQAEAGATELARAALVHDVETLEQPGQVLGRDARAGVADLDDRFATVAAEGEFDFSLVGVFDGIVEQVDEDLLQLEPVGTDRETCVGHRELEFKAFVTGPLLKELDHLSRDFIQVNVLELEFGAPFFEFR